jgi:hypothetical protein
MRLKIQNHQNNRRKKRDLGMYSRKATPVDQSFASPTTQEQKETAVRIFPLR